LHVLGEHAEQAAGEEAGDGFGGVAGLFQRLGEFGEVAGDFARDAGGGGGGVEALRVEPDGGEPRADGLVAQVGEADAM
jgi:hypothetical protein